MKHAGITQAELARRTGLTPGFVSELCTGRGSPSEATLEAIGKATGVPPELLALAGAEAEDLEGITPKVAHELCGNLFALLKEKDRQVERDAKRAKRLGSAKEGVGR